MFGIMNFFLLGLDIASYFINMIYIQVCFTSFKCVSCVEPKPSLEDFCTLTESCAFLKL